MTNELIHVQQGRPTLTSAVVEIIRILNPIGAAAEIISTIGACTVEIGRFRNQERTLIAGHSIATDLIRTRQGVIIALFEARLHDSEIARVEANRLHSAFSDLVAHACNNHLPEPQIEALHGTIRLLADGMNTRARDRGDNLIQLSKSLNVEDTKLAVSAWRALDAASS